MSIQPSTLNAAGELSWEKLTPEQKRERRFAAWLSIEGLEFESPEAEVAYRGRINRLADALRLRTPDRVPVNVNGGAFAAHYYGFNAAEMMNDGEKAAEVAIRFTKEFQPDPMGLAGDLPAKALETLDFKQYDWPGHGLPVDGGLQYNEAEYMKPEEYDDLINDPSDFWHRNYLPRVIGAWEPLKKLMPLPSFVENVGINSHISRFGDPEVQAAYQRLFRAGEAVLTYQQKAAAARTQLQPAGFPAVGGGSSRAPFDALGDGLRGTRGIMIDMLRRSDKLLEALDRMVPLMIRMGLSGTRLGGAPIVGFPLHKAADGWMSDRQFETFYWPSLRKVIQGLNKEGFLVRLFAEGGYGTRLERIREDLSKGETTWHFDATDMEKAKAIFGDVACIQGNVPASLIHAGTPDEVTTYCRKLIDTAGKGGGYILTTGAGIDRKAKPENVRAMIQCAKEYGVYR